MREVRSKKGAVLVPARSRRFLHEESSEEEDVSDEEVCIQYNPVLLPPIKIDLDEIADFLANDIFVQESLASSK